MGDREAFAAAYRTQSHRLSCMVLGGSTGASSFDVFVVKVIVEVCGGGVRREWGALIGVCGPLEAHR